MKFKTDYLLNIILSVQAEQCHRFAGIICFLHCGRLTQLDLTVSQQLQMLLKAFGDILYDADQQLERCFRVMMLRVIFHQSLIQIYDDSQLPLRVVKVLWCYSFTFQKVSSLLENVEGMKHCQTLFKGYQILKRIVNKERSEGIQIDTDVKN